MHVLFVVGFYTSAPASSATTNGALPLAGQGSYSSRSKHLATRFLGVRDWIMVKKLVSDHIPIKDQLSDIYFSRSYV